MTIPPEAVYAAAGLTLVSVVVIAVVLAVLLGRARRELDQLHEKYLRARAAQVSTARQRINADATWLTPHQGPRPPTRTSTAPLRTSLQFGCPELAALVRHINQTTQTPREN